MSESKWPVGQRHQCEFLETIGLDPRTILQDGTNEAGYRRMVLDEAGKRIYDFHPDGGEIRANFEPWPNGPEDFYRLQRAAARDFRDTMGTS